MVLRVEAWLASAVLCRGLDTRPLCGGHAQFGLLTDLQTAIDPRQSRESRYVAAPLVHQLSTEPTSPDVLGLNLR